MAIVACGRSAAKTRRLGAVTALLVATAPLSAAWAQENADQDVSPNISVSERFQSNFAVDGVRSGSFVFLPVLRVSQTYDDNIFTTPDDKIDDFITDIAASLTMRSDWDVHGISLTGSAQRLQFLDNSEESTTDYGVLGRGRFDLARRARATFTGGYSQATEARRSLQTASGDNPVRFSTLRAGVNFDIRQTRFREQFGVGYRKDDFDDVFDSFDEITNTPIAPGVVIDQDFRDREVVDAFFRQSFRVRPTVAVFAEISGSAEEFGAVQPGIGASQDSQTYGVNGGVAFDINKVARGEIGVGYQQRNFDSDLFEDISGLSVDAAFEYFMTDLTTVTVTAARAIRNTATLGVAGFYSTGGDIRIEHELLRSVLLVGTAEYRNEDFRGADRTDELLRFSAGVDYAFRRNVVFQARYVNIDVSSSGAAARQGFTENIFRIGLELRR